MGENVSLIDGHIDGSDRCVICGRDIPEGSQYCVICGKVPSKVQTNYDRIRNMSVEEMVTAIYNGISSDPCDYCNYNNGHCTGIHCKDKANVEIIQKYLENEVTE